MKVIMNTSISLAAVVAVLGLFGLVAIHETSIQNLQASEPTDIATFDGGVQEPRHADTLTLQEAGDPKTCPKKFWLSNNTGDDQIVVWIGPDGATTGTQGSDDVFYWVDDEDKCNNYTAEGKSYKCKGYPVPTSIEVCFEGSSCTSVLDCENKQLSFDDPAGPAKVGQHAFVRSQFGEELNHVVLTEEDLAVIMLRQAEWEVDHTGPAPNMKMVKVVERDEENNWHAYHVYTEGDAELVTDLDGQHVVGDELDRVEVPFERD